MRFGVLMFCAALAGVAGCREGDGPSGPGGTDARLHIISDPAGARIIVDGEDTGLVAPDTVDVTSGEHSLLLELDAGGYTYEYAASFRLSPSDSVATLTAPLGIQCPVEQSATCFSASRRQFTVAGMRIAATPRGALFHWDPTGQGGIYFPANSVDSYIATALPTFAGTIGGQQVSIGPYDHGFFAGRPTPTVMQEGGLFRMTHTSWVVPPLHPARRLTTVRGLEIVQDVVARDDVAQVVLVRLTYRNISNQQIYYDYAPYLNTTPVTYNDAYIGFTMDPDIGDPADDWMSYDPELDMVYAYDARFNEPTFIGEAAAGPGLVGMRILRAPPGTTIQMNGWTNRANLSGDWNAGTNGESVGFGVLSGRQPYLPEHPHPRVGHLPEAAGDARITITAGPLTLAPGQQAEVILAIAVAYPAPGTWAFDQLVLPGDPAVTTRPIHAIAAGLRERMRAAELLLGS